MAFFISEKETEEYLEEETRDLVMPDGSILPFRAFKLLWRSYDYLILCGGYSQAELVQLAITNSGEVGTPFEVSFPDVVVYAHRVLRKAQGID